MWFSRNGLTDPDAQYNYRGTEQGLQCKRRHLDTNVDNVDAGIINWVETDLVTHTVPTV